MIIDYKTISPQIEPDVFIAPSAIVTGQVHVGTKSSIFFGAVIRGDQELIKIGQGTNIQDGVIIHTSHDFPCEIQDGVTVGHRAIIHGATIHSHCIIGMGAIVLDGAVIGEETIVAAGSVVTPGKTFPPRVLILGTPAKVIRPLTEVEIQSIYKNAEEYVQTAKIYQHSILG